KYETFPQGSYDLGTGNKPLNGDYDIDVGIIIKISKDDYPDPVKVKKWIYDALYGHTNSVEIRRPCVTVFYQKDGEDIYHVDLVRIRRQNLFSQGET
ncbi:MAG: cyclic GMP-AMP synthase DncV-like nucleotidyltransferase, partial [Waterburya sp.]